MIHAVQPGTQSPEERGLLTDFWGTGLGDVLEEAAIVDDVAPDASGVLVCTWRYSAFFRPDLDRQLRMLRRRTHHRGADRPPARLRRADGEALRADATRHPSRAGGQ
nr:hypothetical protein [Streptomyces xantholiticus]